MRSTQQIRNVPTRQSRDHAVEPDQRGGLIMHGWDRLREREQGAAKSEPSPSLGRDGRTRPGQTQRAHRNGLKWQKTGQVSGPSRMIGALHNVPVPNGPETQIRLKISRVAQSRRHPSE